MMTLSTDTRLTPDKLAKTELVFRLTSDDLAFGTESRLLMIYVVKSDL